MELFETLTITTHTDGIVRIYGNGGLVFQAQGKYVKAETFIDPKLPPPSGTVQKPNQ